MQTSSRFRWMLNRKFSHQPLSRRITRLLCAAVTLIVAALSVIGTATETIQQNKGTLPAVDERPTADSLGDPLPENALLRLGTERFQHPSGVTEIGLSPDEKTVVTVGRNEVIAWNAATGKRLWRNGFEDHSGGIIVGAAAYGVRALEFTADKEHFYTAGKPGALQVWNIKTGKSEDFEIQFEARKAEKNRTFFRSIDVSPDGERLALGSELALFVCDRDGKVQFRIANNPKVPLAADAGLDRLRFGGDFAYARFSPDGEQLAVVISEAPEEIRLVDVKAGEEIRRIKLSSRLVRMQFTPDGKSIATTERDISARKYNVESGEEVWSFVIEPTPNAECYTSAIAVSPDGNLVAVGAPIGPDNWIRLLDAATGKEVGILKSRGWKPWTLAFTNDSKTLFSSGWDGSIIRWDVDERTQREIPGYVRTKGGCAASPNGNLLAFCDDAGAVHIVSAMDAKSRMKLVEPDVGFEDVLFSPDAKFIATGGPSADSIHIVVWNLASGEKVHQWNWPKGGDPHSSVESLSFTPDGNKLAVAVFRQSMAYIFDLPSDKQIATCPHAEIYGLSFSPDGKRLATAGWDSAIRIWDATSGKALTSHVLPMDPNSDNRMYAVKYSPQGGVLATAHMSGEVRVWSEADFKILSQFTSPGGFIYGALSFSPDGTYLATGGANGAVEVWDAYTAESVWSGGRHENYVYAVGFGRDAKTLLSSPDDGVCYRWDLRPKSDLPETTLDKLYAMLLGGDGVAAYKANWQLASEPDDVLKFLRGKFDRQPMKVDLETIQELIAGLDSAGFQEREAAENALAEYGDAIKTQLEAAVETSESVEQKQRLQKLLEGIASAKLPTTQGRVVSLLTQIGTPEAIELLKIIARNNPETTIGISASRAAQRLELSN